MTKSERFIVAGVVVLLLVSTTIFSKCEGAEMIVDNYPLIGVEWKIIEASDWEVQNVFRSRVEPARKDLEVWGFIDFEKREVWFTTTYDLLYHINLIQTGPRAWAEELQRDLDAARGREWIE